MRLMKSIGQHTQPTKISDAVRGKNKLAQLK